MCFVGDQNGRWGDVSANRRVGVSVLRMDELRALSIGLPTPKRRPGDTFPPKRLDFKNVSEYFVIPC
jgi:hypothetical protein